MDEMQFLQLPSPSHSVPAFNIIHFQHCTINSTTESDEQGTSPCNLNALLSKQVTYTIKKNISLGEVDSIILSADTIDQRNTEGKNTRK